MVNFTEEASKKIADAYVKIIDGLVEKVEQGIELTDIEVCLLTLALKDKYLQETNSMLLDEILPRVLAALSANKEILEIVESASNATLMKTKGSDFVNWEKYKIWLLA